MTEDISSGATTTADRFTVDDLRRALRACAGDDPSMNLDGEIADVEFGTLGYDSLALLETVAALSRSLGVDLPEDALAEATTPQQFVDVVNARLAQPA